MNAVHSHRFGKIFSRTRSRVIRLPTLGITAMTPLILESSIRLRKRVFFPARKGHKFCSFLELFYHFTSLGKVPLRKAMGDLMGGRLIKIGLQIKSILFIEGHAPVRKKDFATLRIP